VSCALPANESVDIKVDGVDYTYQASLAWRRVGHAQRPVATTAARAGLACLLARLDFLGELHEISVRGGEPGLQSCPDERTTYSEREATYYGNVFVYPMKMYACTSPDQTQIPRSAARTSTTAVDRSARLLRRPLRQAAQGRSFPDWPGPGTRTTRGAATAHGHDDVYKGSVTVFLKP